MEFDMGTGKVYDSSYQIMSLNYKIAQFKDLIEY